MEFIGLSPAGLNGIPAEDPAKDDGGPADRRAGHGPRPARRPAVVDRHPRRARERDRHRSPRPAARPTASSTCWPSPTSSASRSTSTSSGRSPTGRRSSPTCSPGGRYTATDMYDAGGVALVMRELLKRPGLLHGDAPTVDGRTIAEIAAAVVETPGQEVVVPIETPIKPTGGLAILHGSLAPGRLRRQAGRPRAAPPPRPGPRLRLGDRLLRRRPRPADQARRRRRHPLRGSGRRPGHAGDAAGHRPRSSARASATRSRS